jgi:hypothetical protein
MAQEYPLANELHLPFEVSRRICLAVMALACLLPSPARAQNYGPNVLPAGSFENVQSTFVPWAGVDDKGNIHGMDGKQLAVGDDGKIDAYNFGPSVAVGDLNGDGKLDLVLADSRGYFWYFPNSGTAHNPVFTQGEIMPIWLGEDRVHWYSEGIDNIVPRIQLVDLDNSKRLDILAGTYMGKLYLIPNVGTASQPDFKPTYKRDALLVNTHKNGVLWCNYLAPFLTNLFGSPNRLDLIMGEGTYSANNVYLLRNIGSNIDPAFDEDHIQKIIPGMGIEQLTPAVLDWDNDGKPDIICGDRTGHLTLYINNSTDPEHPTFAPGTRISIGGVDNFGGCATVTVCDLTDNHLPNLLIGKDDGTIVYALNTGKLGAPVFNTPATPLKGVLPPDCHYLALPDWSKEGAYGVPDELVAAVNPQIEPGFAFPDGVNSKYALKFFVWPAKTVYFPAHYYPQNEGLYDEDNVKLMDHRITCHTDITLKVNTKYRVHFWVKAVGNVSDFCYKLGAHPQPQGKGIFFAKSVVNPVNVGATWTEASADVEIPNSVDPTVTDWVFGLEFYFTGQPTLYMDDLEIQEVLP